FQHPHHHRKQRRLNCPQPFTFRVSEPSNLRAPSTALLHVGPTLGTGAHKSAASDFRLSTIQTSRSSIRTPTIASVRTLQTARTLSGIGKVTTPCAHRPEPRC